MRKIGHRQIISLITEEVIKEYYRGFEKALLDHPVLRSFGFKSMEAALEMLLKHEDFQEFLGPRVTKVKDIMNNTSHLATVEYVLDLMAKQMPDPTTMGEEDLDKVLGTVAAEADSQDIKRDAQDADKESSGIKLTQLQPRVLKSALLQLRNKGIGGEKVKQLVSKAIESLIQGASAAPFIAKKIADDDAPILLKIADEISKILDGDLSNLKERTRRKK